VESYPSKLTFSEDHISAPKESCTSKFLHALESDQVVLAHPTPDTGSALQFFFKRGKIGLKFDISVL